MNKFKKGEAVVLAMKPERPFQMSASVGATAIVVDSTEGDIRVIWQGPGQNGQMNGRYDADRFRYPTKAEAKVIANNLRAQADAIQNFTPPYVPKVGDLVDTSKRPSYASGTRLGKVKTLFEDGIAVLEWMDFQPEHNPTSRYYFVEASSLAYRGQDQDCNCS